MYILLLSGVEGFMHLNLCVCASINKNSLLRFKSNHIDDGALSWEEFKNFFADGILSEEELKHLFNDIDTHNTKCE